MGKLYWLKLYISFHGRVTAQCSVLAPHWQHQPVAWLHEPASYQCLKSILLMQEERVENLHNIAWTLPLDIVMDTRRVIGQSGFPFVAVTAHDKLER